MADGKWKMENGRWKMENGARGVGLPDEGMIPESRVS
jgi:hypothetical protein